MQKNKKLAVRIHFLLQKAADTIQTAFKPQPVLEPVIVREFPRSMPQRKSN